jgi:low affinity Fe/Cu permease
VKRWFGRFACRTAEAAGSPYAFVVALLLILAWAAAGPWFAWSDSHSLFINTATTCGTWLLCFLIQHSTNRSEAALQRKLDELIVALPQAHDEVAGIEREERA